MVWSQGPGSGYTMLTVENVLAKRGVQTYERNVRNGDRERLIQGDQWAKVCGGHLGQGAIIHTASTLQHMGHFIVVTPHGAGLAGGLNPRQPLRPSCS